MPLTLVRLEDPWPSTVRSVAQALGTDFESVLIDTMDGVQDPASHRRVLVREGAVKGVEFVHPTLPVIERETFFRLDLSNKRVFPHYDTVWFIRRNLPDLTLPPHLVWYWDEQEKECRHEFLPVEEWMKAQGAMVGVASSYRTLVISLGPALAPPCNDEA